MHITVYCPRCRSRYQLDPAMLGQRMRCPNTVCREVFEVREETPAALPPPSVPPPREERALPRPDQAIEPPASAYSSGKVGEVIPLLPIEEEQELQPEDREDPLDSVIPLLPAELAHEKRTEEPRETHSWDEPPPVRRAPSGQVPYTPPAVADEPLLERPSRPARSERRSSPPLEVAPSSVALVEEPAEVKRAAETEADHDGHVDAHAGESTQRRRVSSLLALVMILLGVGVIGGSAWFAWSQFVAREERLLGEARREYDEGKFGLAGQKFRQLEKEYPQSEHQRLYRFFGPLSEVRHDAQSLVELDVALERLDAFVQAHKDNPLLQDYRVDLWETTHKLVQELLKTAREKLSRDVLTKTRAVLTLAESFRPPDVDASRRQQVEAAIADIEMQIVRVEERQRFVQWARSLEPTSENLKLLREELIKRGLAQDPEFKPILAQLAEAIRLQVRYVSAPAKIPLPPESFEPCLLVAPIVEGPQPPPAPNGQVMLALVRGVLYGLDQGNGRVLWAMRVGIDTATLPVGLPATDSSRPVFLVLSAERNTLRAVDAASGEPLWEHRLSAACLGRPTIIRKRVYVPTVAGRIEELEIIQGHQLGYFELPDQRLTVGGVWQPDTDLLYVPGDGQTVYVLDVVQKKCVATVETGHPSGSLRASPVLVNRIDPGRRDNPESLLPPAYLILCQADGLGAMKLRVFDIDPEQKLAVPALEPEPRIRGWSWFPAYQDGEKLSFVTDTGVLGLYGIRQVRNVDKALFSELREEFQLGVPTGRPQRAQVVQAEENDFWVLANGQLQRLHLNRFAQQVEPVWKKPLVLGAPLHEGQVDESGKTLFVLTQTEPQQTCLATAVRAADGQVLWQRQLGVECPSEPLLAGRDVIALDQGGGVFAFAPTKDRDLTDEWLLGGQLLAGPVPGGLRWAHAATSPEGNAVTVVGTNPAGKELIVRRLRRDPGSSKTEVTEERATLDAPLAGVPALGADHLLLCLADGSLLRIPLAAVAKGGRTGPNWRSERADDDALGFVTVLGAEEFLMTDGSRGVQRWRWSANGVEFKEVSRRTVPARIVSAPVLLPNDQVCVADSQGGLTLLQGAQLKPVHAWQLEGKITAGPFRRGDHIGCIVDRRRLVWVDPSQKTPLWEFTAAEAIVGQPQQVGRFLVVADQSGKFVALDPATGRPHGPGYALQANVAPGTAPVAYGPGHVLAPLTDGTLLLLPRGQLAPPVIEFPWVW